MIRSIHKTEEILDFTYTLCTDDQNASYSRMYDKNKIKLEIDRAITEDSYEVLACYSDDELVGVCIYYWIDESLYAQTKAFLIERDYETVASRFINHIESKLSGYELWIGMPPTNRTAISYFEKMGIECVESSIVTEMFGIGNNYEFNNHITEVTESDFHEYAGFHDSYAIPLEMYYDSKNLRADLNRFRVFVYKKDSEIIGSIFVKCLKEFAEVFGLFVDSDQNDDEIEKSLIGHMLKQLSDGSADIHHVMYFIHEDSSAELQAALDTGFKIKESYKCFRYGLQ